MEEPVWKEHDLHLVERESRPVIDVSYVELPEKLTYRIDAGYVLSAVAFLDLFVFIPGTVEDNPVLTVALIFLLAVCARLAAREEGKRK